MAESAVSQPAALNSDLVPAKKKRSNAARKPLAQKNAAADDESNGTPSPGKAVDPVAVKEVIQPSPKAVKQTKASKKTTKQTSASSFEKDLLEMQERLEKLRLEKERTEELLKEKDEILKSKEEELEARGKKQEQLQVELKKLQKLKEFKPTMNFPIAQQSKDKDNDSKKKKGGSETKRPSAPYILWCKDQWAEVKKENPDADFKETSIILGAKWKTVSAEEKKPYEEQYQSDKEAYLKIVAKEKREKAAMKLFDEENKQKTAMEFYEQYMQFLQEAETGNKKAKKEKDPLKPKKPMLAYFIYSNERRPALMGQSKSVLEISKITGEEWKTMSERKKKPYEEMAKKNKEKYLAEMEEYTKKKAEEELNQKTEEEEMLKIQKQEALQLLKKKEKTDNIIKKTKEDKQKKKQAKEGKAEVDPNKPKKPASSYILFSKEARKNLQEERPGVNNATLSALISVKWKEITDEEKQRWNDKAAQAMDAYKKEMEEYKKSAASSSVNEG
uniref:HMG box domain-containing protein n=1 Tax=Kalanchoe fedtschenkoi TaxID=63787 RepID=A0A7N0U7J4_KALFE